MTLLLWKPPTRGQRSSLRIMPKRSMRMRKHRVRVSHRKISRRLGCQSPDRRNRVRPASRERRMGPRAEDVEDAVDGDEVVERPGQLRRRLPS
jgi:hypothetical protein